MSETLLQIENLKTYFDTWAGIVKAVDGVSLDVRRGETLGLVGESGSGKTVTALSVLRIVPRPGKTIDGRILFKGEDLLSKTEEEMQKIRGAEMALIFQDPSTSLNPVFSIETQLVEVIRRHQRISKEDAVEKTEHLLEIVGIPDAKLRMDEFPHQFSGGMKQRVAIARALSCEPTLLFADEPTTNLDVTIQAQILDLMRDLKSKFDMSMVLITHNMGIVAEMADRVTVMYAGRVCESSDMHKVFTNATHPYTVALMNAIPRIGIAKQELQVIPGNIPNLIEPPSGCRFHPRCKYARPNCKKVVPELEEVEKGHVTACLRWKEIEADLKKERERAV
ncbi:MAG: ABC transporter ATP-binding protein [Candidatus Bathyarchaeota archaeon]|nr:ABC transporter ATP-binding protein [Candidatus Bathyarchaeota archaeon]